MQMHLKKNPVILFHKLSSGITEPEQVAGDKSVLGCFIEKQETGLLMFNEKKQTEDRLQSLNLWYFIHSLHWGSM